MVDQNLYLAASAAAGYSTCCQVGSFVPGCEIYWVAVNPAVIPDPAGGYC